MNEEYWEKIGYTLASSYRRKIIFALGDGPLTPKQLSQICDIGIGHVSNVLKGLREMHLVKCLNPKMRKGRLYALTQEGTDILDFLLKIKNILNKNKN
ncbi:MAG: winged helix-turn-helix domain-containing protein [Candidatus Methanofastidiosia archaeon]|jgi:DNA-binding transcriptional ArsR family regulator